MWIALLTALIGIFAVYFVLKGRKSGAAALKSRHNGIADIPSRVFNPASYKNIPLIVAWEFMAPNLSRSCQFARNNAGIRKAAVDCAALPLADCSSDACLCHYRPIFDERRRSRRNEHDRRTEYRMDDKPERRNAADRRSGNQGWQDKNMR